jgi:hypothetical protein
MRKAKKHGVSQTFQVDLSLVKSLISGLQARSDGIGVFRQSLTTLYNALTKWIDNRLRGNAKTHPAGGFNSNG